MPHTFDSRQVWLKNNGHIYDASKHQQNNTSVWFFNFTQDYQQSDWKFDDINLQIRTWVSFLKVGLKANQSLDYHEFFKYNEEKIIQLSRHVGIVFA